MVQVAEYFLYVRTPDGMIKRGKNIEEDYRGTVYREGGHPPGVILYHPQDNEDSEGANPEYDTHTVGDAARYLFQATVPDCHFIAQPCPIQCTSYRGGEDHVMPEAVDLEIHSIRYAA